MQLTRRFESAAELEAFAAELSMFARPGMAVLLQGDLGLVDLPVAGEKPGILVAVGIAEHHFLQRLFAFAAHQQPAVEGLTEQGLHHRGGPLQVFHRFKQGDHQQGGPLSGRVHQACLLGQQQHLQQV